MPVTSQMYTKTNEPAAGGYGSHPSDSAVWQASGLGLFLTHQEENSEPLHDIKGFLTLLYTKAFISESQRNRPLIPFRHCFYRSC